MHAIYQVIVGASLPGIALVVLIVLLHHYERDVRSAILSASLIWGTLVAASSEVLSIGSSLTASSLLAIWLVLDLVLIGLYIRVRMRKDRPVRVAPDVPFSPFDRLALGFRRPDSCLGRRYCDRRGAKQLGLDDLPHGSRGALDSESRRGLLCDGHPSPALSKTVGRVCNHAFPAPERWRPTWRISFNGLRCWEASRSVLIDRKRTGCGSAWADLCGGWYARRSRWEYFRDPARRTTTSSVSGWCASSITWCRLHGKALPFARLSVSPGTVLPGRATDAAAVRTSFIVSAQDWSRSRACVPDKGNSIRLFDPFLRMVHADRLEQARMESLETVALVGAIV